MSEYHSYEFQAIDRPLGEKEMAELRAISTRAVITATSFTNTYQWGDLKADPKASTRRKIGELIKTKQQKNYDQAVQLLVDLRDAAALRNRTEAFEEYLAGLRGEQARKPAFRQRLDRAGL